jgi:predicted amidohydrolase
LIDAISVARATENNIVFVYANAAGKTVNPNKSIDILIGHSQIVTPFAGALAKCSHNREAMFIQEVDTSILTLSDKAYRFREDIFGRIV